MSLADWEDLVTREIGMGLVFEEGLRLVDVVESEPDSWRRGECECPFTVEPDPDTEPGAEDLPAGTLPPVDMGRTLGKTWDSTALGSTWSVVTGIEVSDTSSLLVDQ
jgi:hypothetical protein